MKHFHQHLGDQLEVGAAAGAEADEEVEGSHEGRPAVANGVHRSHGHLSRLLEDRDHLGRREDEIFDKIFD